MEEIKPHRKSMVYAIGAALIICLLYWLMVLYIDVYAFALVGAIYEILWLPMLLLPATLPIILLVWWGRRKFTLKTPYFWLFLASLCLLIFLLTRSL